MTVFKPSVTAVSDFQSIIVKCECGQDGPYPELITHFDQCSKVKVMCAFTCGAMIERYKITEHLKNDCAKMMVTCKQCDSDVPKSETETHDCIKFLKGTIQK